MTEKQMSKYIGKRVCITKHIFSYSVNTEKIIGEVLEPVEVFNHVLRDNKVIHKKHLDFYIDGKLICWNELKLSKRIEVLESAN